MEPDSQSPVWCNETTFKKSLKEYETAISSDLGRSNLQNFLFIYLPIYLFIFGIRECVIYICNQNQRLAKI